MKLVNCDSSFSSDALFVASSFGIFTCTKEDFIMSMRVIAEVNYFTYLQLWDHISIKRVWYDGTIPCMKWHFDLGKQKLLK